MKKAGLPLLIVVASAIVLVGFVGQEHQSNNLPLRGDGKAPKSYVGSAMTLLATLDQAQVLPPEGTKEADHLIKSVIQFQSAFTKSPDPYLQEFVRAAVIRQQGEHAPTILAQFHSSGWTAEVLQALADAELHTPVDELRSLAAAFGPFNLSVEDFQRFMKLVRDGVEALAMQGQSFYEIFAAHRKTMPGGMEH